MKNAVGYLRVSTVGQAGEDKFGLREQRDIVAEYAAAHDYEITEWYTDGGISGVKEERPAMNALLFGEVRNPPIEAVIVAKSDRVARDIKLYYYYLMLLEKKGIVLISATEPVVNDETGLGSIYHALMLFVAEQERKNILLRTYLGRKKKGMEGGYIGGRPPYGYLASNGELIINPGEAKAVRAIFSLRERGCSLNEICTNLIDGGIKTRKRTYFTAGSIGHILANEAFYMGFVYREGTVIKGKHEPILANPLDSETRKRLNIPEE